MPTGAPGSLILTEITALKIAAKLPPALDGCGRYLTGNLFHENQLQIPARVDYQLNSKETVFGRYILTTIDTAVPYELNPSNLLTSNGVGTDDRA
ncbi:MAG: hypothetical protein DMG96_20665 [Acidobacteria bacterium]|nr:MAG: hypothetical protein DMG96_20665 [Acidobacteriota bacterium]